MQCTRDTFARLSHNLLGKAYSIAINQLACMYSQPTSPWLHETLPCGWSCPSFGRAHLSFDSIISSDHKDHQVGDRSATSPHRRKGCMARSVQERDALLAVWHGHLHSALCSPGLSRMADLEPGVFMVNCQSQHQTQAGTEQVVALVLAASKFAAWASPALSCAGISGTTRPRRTQTAHRHKQH